VDGGVEIEISPYLEMILLDPISQQPLLHEAHLSLLRSVLGVDGVREEEDAAASRPWCLYVRDGVEVPAADGRATDAIARLFALDAPLILRHAVDEAEAGGGEDSGDAPMGEEEVE
tara:strand:+ start:265 stop:612 length:348 start_codon:yes stop_codon:yes gene_type:complete